MWSTRVQRPYVRARTGPHHGSPHHDRYVVCGSEPATLSRGFPTPLATVHQRAFDPNDPESPNPDPTVPTTSFTARWRTIMAYNRQCTSCRFRLPAAAPFLQSGPDSTPIPATTPWAIAGLERHRRGRTARPMRCVCPQPDARLCGELPPDAPDDHGVLRGSDQYTATEGGTAATVTVQLSEAPTRPIDVPLTAVAHRRHGLTTTPACRPRYAI